MFGPLSWLNPGGLRAPPLLTQILLDQIEEAQLGLAFHWEEKVYQVEYGTGQLSVSPSDLRATAWPAPGGGVRVALGFDVSPHRQIAHSVLAIVGGILGAIAGLIIAPPEAG
jgi:hypothetical protein